MQLKHLLLTTAAFAAFSLTAQIPFVSNLSFGEIKSRAKAENKIIFIDAFTTWCGPCKKMDNEVYTNKAVGNYFGNNFISVKVQMDQTANDDESVKSWYSTAKQIESDYKIAGYPSLLFLLPEGKVVHQVLGYRNPDEFLKEARYAIEPDRLEADKQAADFYRNMLEPYLRTYPAWKDIQQKINEQQPGKGEALLLENIIKYYNNGITAGNASKNLLAAVELMEKKYPGTLSVETLNSAAFAIFGMSNDKNELNTALKYSKRVIDKDDNPAYLDTYANLLYKLGKKPEAIAIQQKAVQKAAEFEVFKTALQKMQDSEPTWKDFGKQGRGKVDLSGTWVLDSLRSDFGELTTKAAPLSMKLAQQGNAITLERSFAGTTSAPETLNLDGTVFNTELQDTKVTRNAIWSQDKSILTIFSHYTVQRPGENQWEYTRDEAYTLVNEGKELFLTRITITPDKVDTIKAIYSKK